jgi:hypothetical protein
LLEVAAEVDILAQLLVLGAMAVELLVELELVLPLPELTQVAVQVVLGM